MKTRRIMIAMMALSLTNLVTAEIIWNDSFATADSADQNAKITTRTSGSIAIRYDTKNQPTQNTKWSIGSEQLIYTGDGAGSGALASPHLYTVNAGNGAYQNLGAFLAGKKYEIRFDVLALGGDAVNALGVSLSDSAFGAADLFAGQIRAGSQLEINKSGTINRVNDWVPGTSYNVKMMIDETGATPTYEVFVDGVSKDSGELSFAAGSRYVYIQTRDMDGQLNGTLDNFAIETIPEPATLGMLSGASVTLIVLRRFMAI